MATIDIEFSINDDEILAEIEAVRTQERRKLKNVLEMVARETVAFLRSTTSETRPGVRPGEPSRKAHPGGWADVTANLSNAYDFKITDRGGDLILRFVNTMEYAIYLEQRDGYYVLSGVTDSGGPVEKALRKALPRVAPNWRLA